MNDNRRHSTEHQQQAIVLFYKYFSSPPSSSQWTVEPAIRLWWNDPKGNVRNLYHWHEENLLGNCSSTTKNGTSTRKRRLPLVGRVLIAPEGINGTLSGKREDVEAYIERMKNYDDVSCRMVHEGFDNDGIGCSIKSTECSSKKESDTDLRLFREVDYKLSYEFTSKPLFPDLKISIVKEIVSTSGLVDVHDVPLKTGKHLTPEEFHDILEESKLSRSSPTQSDDKTKEIVLIDVRNTFEHDIGYFVDPKTNAKAIDPETTTFSSFDKFCERKADEFRNKKVMMYCTGGIRCEKASILLKRRGVEDVNQLSGGIHRYLEKYGDSGHFKGLNFTFDKRVAMKPNFAFPGDESGAHLARNQKNCDVDKTEAKDDGCYEIVGRCVECNSPFDELCGSRVCTVCRDLVLVCEICRSDNSLREYHCKRHSAWKTAYFSFLEIFDKDELEAQLDSLRSLRDEASNAKNTRRTLTRQINKVESRIRGIENGSLVVDKNAPRRCRSCQEPLGKSCDGKCWGFWRKAERLDDTNPVDALETNLDNDMTYLDTDVSSSSIKKLRGRRAKQKHEAEIDFLR